MISIKQIITKIKADYPDLTLSANEKFYYCAKESTIFYNSQAENSLLILLHELAHYSLGHDCYKYDIDRLKMESQAWSYTEETLSPKYGVEYNPDIADHYLDSYRDWVYKNSACPNCDSVGYQDKTTTYHCLECHNKWKARRDKIK